MLAERPGADDMTGLLNQPGPQGAATAQPGPKWDADHPIAFGADAAHELANLIMIVSGSLEQLRRQPLDQQGQQQLMRAEWGALQVARLTRQVLSQAQGGDGMAAVVDLNPVTAGFAAIMGQMVSESVQLTADLAPVRQPVRLDPALLELVLLNLVRNAADAMPDGGSVTLQTKGPRLDGLGDQLAVEVSVSDSGTGMALDVAARATEAFFTTKPSGRGAGLGLWMAQRFASAYDGKMSIETAPGQGTTVRLTFPYAGDAEPD